ncbi:hypothetical protein BC830DRAFT_1174714 [Chytriomyces sp. MP71]|nr:hypothetical protein BC830DRAFT_1174714 [Chytriomyces sp. MP71]
MELSFQPLTADDASDAEERVAVLSLGPLGNGERQLVTGHHGITPAAVAGLVRIVIDPRFTLAHAHIAARPVLELRFKGSVRTLNANAPMAIRQGPFKSLAWTEKSIVSDAMLFNDPLDQGLRRDASGNINVLMPGTYEVPFRFALASILPPSFSGLEGQVSYTLHATLKFKERKGTVMKEYSKSVREPVVIRRYNSEHIINPSDSMNLRESLPVLGYPFDPPSPNSSDETLPRPQRLTNAVGRELNPAALSIPSPDPSSTVAEAPDGNGLLMPPLPLTRTLTGERDVISDNFTESAVFTNVDSEDPIRYHIVVPSRSFGPDDSIVANVHISKLPDGFAVHHIDLLILAEVTSQGPTGPKTSSQTLMRHRDYPEDAGHFWNRKIVVAAQNLFRNTPTDLVERISNDAASPHVDQPEPTPNESSMPENELPPDFEQISQQFIIPNGFEAHSPRRRAAVLLAAQDPTSIAMVRMRSTPSPVASIALDAGLSVGNSSVFLPWVYLRDEEEVSPGPSRSPSLRRSGGGGGLGSRRASSTRGVLPIHTGLSVRSLSPVSMMSEQEVSPLSRRGSARISSRSLGLPTRMSEVEANEEDTVSEPAAFLNVREPRPDASSPLPPRTDTASLPALPQPESPVPPSLRSVSRSRSLGGRSNQGTTTDITAGERILRPLRRMMNRLNIPLPRAAVSDAHQKPLNTFTSPFISVRHILRVEIVCHKPLPLGIGSQPIYLPFHSKPGPEENNSNLFKGGVQGMLKRGLMLSPVGFRHTTRVEAPIVLHHASERDRQFLHSYLYGPPWADGTVVENAPAYDEGR